MLDLGWSEIAVIVLVALVVIGPKDLPRLAREVGKWTGKARAMARDFQRHLDDMAREADLQDIKAQVDKVSRTSLTDTIRETIDPDRSIQKALDTNEIQKSMEIEGSPFSPPPPSASPPPASPPPAALPPASQPGATVTADASATEAATIDAGGTPAISASPEAIAEIERALVKADEPVPVAATTPSKPDQAG